MWWLLWWWEPKGNKASQWRREGEQVGGQGTRHQRPERTSCRLCFVVACCPGSARYLERTDGETRKKKRGGKQAKSGGGNAEAKPNQRVCVCVCACVIGSRLERSLSASSLQLLSLSLLLLTISSCCSSIPRSLSLFLNRD